MLASGGMAAWGGLPQAGLETLVFGITGVVLGGVGANVGEHFATAKATKGKEATP